MHYALWFICMNVWEAKSAIVPYIGVKANPPQKLNIQFSYKSVPTLSFYYTKQ